jgi:hypothetical protein
LDISNLSAISVLGQWKLKESTEKAKGIALSGDGKLLFVAHGTNGVIILDIQSPAEIAVKLSIPIPGNNEKK